MGFNDFQLKAIRDNDHDILVSAGAGSGKTSVMIERIAKNLIEGKVDVDKLLVVTFTNAAASEMRHKLERKLNEVLANKDTTEETRARVAEQMELLGQSDICTLHKFCQTIIQKYFYTIDLDPSFVIGEESETAVLRTRALNDMLREMAQNKNEDFMLLSSTFDDKRSFNKIKDYIYKIHIFLTNQPDISAFKSRVQEAFSGDLDNNKLTQIINQYMIEMIDYFISSYNEIKFNADRLGFDALSAILGEYISTLNLVKSTNTFSQNHFAVFNMPAFKNLTAKTDDPECMELKEKASELKKKCKLKLDDLTQKILISNDLTKISQDLQATKRILDAMFNLVEEFEKRYLKIKKERNIVDFSDLEHYAHMILNQPEVNAEIRQRYGQIYVDEYQDVNDIQEEIISKVHSARDLFLVGDVKQSIYGFRNTNPQIFIDKQLNFGAEQNQDAITIDLNLNYRTDQKILDFVNFVFGRLMTKELGGIEYIPDNEMRSGLTFKPVEGSLPQIEIDIIDKPNKRQSAEEKLTPDGVYRVGTAPIKEGEDGDYARSEGVVIAQRIMQYLSEQKTIYDARIEKEREITFSDITLLCRGRSASVAIILDTLAEYGIPVAPLEQASVFEEYEIQVLYSFLNLVNNLYDDIHLTAFLTSPIIGLDENALAHVRAGAGACVNYYDCVFKYVEKDDEIADKIKYALELINEGAENLLNNSIYNILNDFCEKTNYLSLVGAMPEGDRRVKNVLGFITGFNGKRYNYDLSEYLSSIEQAGETPNVTPEYTIGSNVVKVETMHHSKGLEYPIVFLIDTGHGFNKDDKKGDFLLNSNLGVGLYKYDQEKRTKVPTISLSAIKIAMDDKAYAENLRLFYVAMTRAKNHLIITGCCDVAKLKSSTSPFAIKSQGNFLELILAAFRAIEIEPIVIGGKHMKLTLAENNDLHINVYPKIDYTNENTASAKKTLDFGNLNADFDGIIAKNSGFVYDFEKNTHLALKNSVTALNREAGNHSNASEVPQQIVNEAGDLEKITTEQGIAFHKAMQFIDFDLPDEDSVRQYLTAKLTSRELELVDIGKIWTAICKIKTLLEGAQVYREQEFMMRVKHCDLFENSDITDEIMVQGIIDLVIKKDGKIILLDYKTSASHNIEKTAQNYVMQLNCYAKAIQGALNVGVAQKFLYFFLQERLILIDN